jgi:hypothetical protein
MPTSIILDLETLSTRPNSIITEIGVLAFDRETLSVVEGIVITPSLFHQLGVGRHACPDTLAFHRKKGTLPTEIHPQDPREDCSNLRRFFEHHQPHRIWIQGPDFDRPILEDFLRQFGAVLPWEFWRTRDTRTLWDTAFPDKKHPPRPHHALDDCLATLDDLKASLIALNRAFAA